MPSQGSGQHMASEALTDCGGFEQTCPERQQRGAASRSRLRQRYAFMAPLTAAAVIGSERTRAPTALKIALASARATTVTAGSPTPAAFSPLAMTLTATSGTWLIRSRVQVSKLVC